MNITIPNLVSLSKLLLASIVFMASTLPAQSQTQTVSGTVVSATENQPLAGVTVQLKGSKSVTVTTDAKGHYSLKSVSPNDSLLFTSVGFQREAVAVNGQVEVNVSLQVEITSLDQTVVIGYGTAKKRDLTGSVSQVNARTFQNQSMTQVTDMLSGTTPGVYTIQSTTAAGGGTIDIRGPSSLTAGNSPLIVLDGAIYNGSISDINPNDVESMDILKDASSAAVFGSKAASGVILITTKKGKLGKPTIDFAVKTGLAGRTNDLKPWGPKEYLDLHRDILAENNPNLPYGFFFRPDELPEGVTIEQWRAFSSNPAPNDEDEWIGRIRLRPIEVLNYKAGKTTDFYDLAIQNGLRQDYSLGIGGGTKDLKYYWSVGYLNNKGIIVGDQFSTIRSRLNLDLKVTDWLSIGTNSQFAVRDESVSPANLVAVERQSPYGSMWNDDGTLRLKPDDYYENPLEDYYGQDRLKKISSLFSILYAQIKLPFGIQYKVSFQPNFQFGKDFNFWSSNTLTGSQDHVGGYGTADVTSSYQWLLDNLLTWNKKIGVHGFDVTLLANAERSKSWWAHQENSNFAPNELLTYNALQFGTRPSLANDNQQSSGDALMARLNYTLLDKYLFTASVRRDGYSAFGQENPRATFPAFAFAWRISDESFYNINWLSRMKLRLSWGENGNRDVGTYSALARLGSVLGYDGSNVQSGVYNTTLSNIGLRWERTNSTNIGLDFGLFKDRVSVSIDAYDATTTDLLLNRQLPIITGFTSVISNLGELGNRGLELAINTNNVTRKNFGWTSNLVFSLNRNKIKKLWGDQGEFTLLGVKHTGELPDFSNQYFPGYASDVIWNYDITGVWQLGEKNEAEVYNMQPGDYKAVDVNNDGKFLQLDDKKFIGHTAPRYRLGLRNEFTFFNNFSASIFIRADLGHLRSMGFLTADKSVLDRTNSWALPHWSPVNPTNDYQRNAFPDNVDKYAGGLVIYKPTGFVRVQDVSLSYNFPASLLQSVRLNSLRAFVSARNLFTFTDYPGFDPESGMTPMPKVFTLGLNLSL